MKCRRADNKQKNLFAYLFDLYFRGIPAGITRNISFPDICFLYSVKIRLSCFGNRKGRKYPYKNARKMSPVQYRTHFRRSKQLLSHIRGVLHFQTLLGRTAVRWRARNGLFVLSSSFNAPLPLPFTAYGISKPRVIAREHGITMRIGGLQQNLPGIALAVGAVVAEAVPALYPGRRNETIVRAVIGPRIIE